MNYSEFLKRFKKKEVIVHQDIAEHQPMVSVCVQTYQHGNYIKECLDGILMQQTTFPFEILLGDDASTDGTREICLEYGQKHPDKIRLFLHHRENNIAINGNPTGRFNFLYNLYNARGKYIALCEGDDYWTDPLKLQKQVDFLEKHPDINLCFHRATIQKDNNSLYVHPIPAEFEIRPFDYKELLRYSNFITTASVVLRVPLIFNIPQWFLLVPFGDLALYKIITENKQIVCLNEVMSVYRIHPEGIFQKQNSFEKKQQHLRFYSVIFNFLGEEEKKIVKSKKKEIIKQIIRNMDSKSKLLRFLFGIFLRARYYYAF